MKGSPHSSKLTSQGVLAQIDLGHAVAELANVRRQLETGVVLQLNLAALDELPAQKLDRDGSCAYRGNGERVRNLRLASVA